jgi:hypothetical protein
MKTVFCMTEHMEVRIGTTVDAKAADSVLYDWTNGRMESEPQLVHKLKTVFCMTGQMEGWNQNHS